MAARVEYLCQELILPTVDASRIGGVGESNELNWLGAVCGGAERQEWQKSAQSVFLPLSTVRLGSVLWDTPQSPTQRAGHDARSFSAPAHKYALDVARPRRRQILSAASARSRKPAATPFAGAASALLRVQLSSGIQVVEVEDGVEHEWVGPEGLAAIDRIVGEQYDVPLLHRDVDDDRPLRDVSAAVQ